MSKRVLVAEDEPNIAEPLSFLLERAGFEVVVEANGREALDTLMADLPDVLILDVMLPDLDGYEILRHLRADRHGEDLPVLILTAKGQGENRELAMKYGADLFMTKPFANAEILSAVKKLAEGRPG